MPVWQKFYEANRGKGFEMIALMHIGRMSEEFLAQTMNGLLTR